MSRRSSERPAVSRPGDPFDPERFRRQGHAVVDELADYLASVTDRRLTPVLPWREPADQVAELEPFAEEPTGSVEGVVKGFLERGLHQHDPRCMGHQDAVTLPDAALAGLAMLLMNNDPSTYEIAPPTVAAEQHLLRWMIREVGYPEGAGGVLTSGGSLGNLTALLAARQAHGGFDVWQEGYAGGGDFCVLASEQIHYCVRRAVQIMGWGTSGCVPVPVDESFRMRARELDRVLDETRRGGRRVVAVVASAGTTATATFDPLVEIADLCDAHGLWLHVDGAHGASAVLSPGHRHLVAGVERADSLVWDFHKMLHMPALLTSVLFRDGRHAYRTFRQEETYLFDGDDGWYNSGNRTVECTRPGMGQLLYACLRSHGVGVFRESVARCFDLAKAFAETIRSTSDFELAVEPEGNIVCFRHTPPAGADLDALQTRARLRLARDGAYFLTTAELRGRTWLRCSLMNPLTHVDDLVGLLAAVRGAVSGDRVP